MAKLKDDVVLTVVLADGEGFRKGTAKAKLLAMSQELGEFTKPDWIKAAGELFVEKGLESAIYDKSGLEGWAKAWWNEFYTKHGVFRPQDEA